MTELTLYKYLNMQCNKEANSLISKTNPGKDIIFPHKLALPFITRRLVDTVINL